MSLPRVRFTVRRMMVATATLAVVCGTLNGAPAYNFYTFYASSEQRFREDAVIWEEKNQSARAEESRRLAEDQGEQKRSYLPGATTIPTLIVLGIVLGGVGLSITVLQRAGLSGRPRWLESLRATCWTGAKIVALGLSIGAILCFVLSVIVFLFEDD
jgi:hypothetical protein